MNIKLSRFSFIIKNVHVKVVAKAAWNLQNKESQSDVSNFSSAS